MEDVTDKDGKGNNKDEVDVGDTSVRTRYVDNGWPQVGEGQLAVSETHTDRTGALSPFGSVEFPLPSDELPYLHPVTVVNR